MKNQVYVLDDDTQYLSLINTALHARNIKPHLYSSATEFVANLPSEGLLILDLAMPELDGIEVIQKIAEQRARVSVVLISGMDDILLLCAKELAQAHQMPVLGTLSKPFRINELLALIDKE